MPSIDFRCVNGEGFIAEGIDFVTRGGPHPVCHVEFLRDGKSFGARANGGVQWRPIAHYATDIRFSAPCTQDQYDKTWGFLADQDSKPYDTIADVGILVNRNWHEDGSWMCAELWAAAMEAGGIIHKLDQTIHMVTPEDALLIASAMF